MCVRMVCVQIWRARGCMCVCVCVRECVVCVYVCVHTLMFVCWLVCFMLLSSPFYLMFYCR